MDGLGSPKSLVVSFGISENNINTKEFNKHLPPYFPLYYDFSVNNDYWLIA